MYSIGPKSTILRLCTQSNDTGVFSLSPVAPGVELGRGVGRGKSGLEVMNFTTLRVQSSTMT